MENITLVAVDIAKNVFQTRAVNHAGKALRERRVRREQLIEEIKNYPARTRIAMEACGGSNYWGRELKKLGFDPVLIAPQHVKPYVRNQKTDRADAEGIAEAASRATTRFIPIKSIEQQDIQCLHRTRERYVTERTASMNHIRGLLMEYGVVIERSKEALLKALPEVLEKEEATPVIRKLVRSFLEDFKLLEQRIDETDKEIEALGKSIPACVQLDEIPGIGMLTATAFYSALAHMDFKNGRQCAAYIGLVPRHSNSGEKEQNGKITKTGNKYLRQLFVHGGRSVLRSASKGAETPYKTWVKKVKDKGYCKAAVAVANKNTRIAWNVMKKGILFSSDLPRQGVNKGLASL